MAKIGFQVMLDCVSIHAPARGATVLLQIRTARGEFAAPARTCVFQIDLTRRGTCGFPKRLKIQGVAPPRISQDFPVSLGFAHAPMQSMLKDKGTLLIERGLGAHVLHAPLPVRAEEIEPQAVLFRIHHRDQLFA